MWITSRSPFGRSVVSCVFLLTSAGAVLWAQATRWPSNATIESSCAYTCSGLGDAQGVSLRDGKIYLYGDVTDASPRQGVIREYDLQLRPTGRVVWLRREGKPVLRHPTGLTWDTRWNTFLGDTVNRKAAIYQLDWEKMWRDGNLDHALIERVDDDAAINGCRPELVRVGGRTLLATADYGDIHPEIRFYDPDKMLAARRTSAPGVVVARVLCGPFNQNLHWDEKGGCLVCIQNVIAGRGWRLDVLDLDKAIADGRAWGPGVRRYMLTFPQQDELEGFRPLDERRSIFVTSSPKGNVLVGSVRR
jgi:hypothetical protein